MMTFRPISLLEHYYTPAPTLTTSIVQRERACKKKKPSAKAGDIAKEMKVRNCRVLQELGTQKLADFLIATVLF
jgi:hypothetical protein